MSSVEWRQRRVLVTGARGFIGSHLCRRLVGLGALVWGVSREASNDRAPGTAWITDDLSRPSAVRRAIDQAQPDVVFHLAGHVTGRQRLEDVEPTFVMNLASTVHLLTAAAHAGGCPIVLAGSMQEPHADDPAAAPCSPYAASKWACSAYASMFRALFELPLVTARLFMVYGPEQWDETKLLPYVILSLLRGESPRVSSGSRQLDWVFVHDVVDALLTVAAPEHMDGRTIDIGTGRLTTVRDIIDRLIAITGSRVPVQYGSIPDRPLERPHAAQVESTQRQTGWMARTSLNAGLAETVAWYRGQLARGGLIPPSGEMATFDLNAGQRPGT